MDRLLALLRGVRARKPSAAPAMAGILLGCVTIPAHVIAQQVYKWTDSTGQTHYSDHAPASQTVTTVDIPKAPPKPAGTSHSSLGFSTNAGIALANPQVSATQGPKWRTLADMTKDAKPTPTDQELVAKCKAQRDTDCNQIGEIRKREAILNEPPPARWRCWGAVRSCEWVAPPPQTNSANTPPATKKKKSTSKYTIDDR